MAGLIVSGAQTTADFIKRYLETQPQDVIIWDKLSLPCYYYAINKDAIELIIKRLPAADLAKSTGWVLGLTASDRLPAIPIGSERVFFAHGDLIVEPSDGSPPIKRRLSAHYPGIVIGLSEGVPLALGTLDVAAVEGVAADTAPTLESSRHLDFPEFVPQHVKLDELRQISKLEEWSLSDVFPDVFGPLLEHSFGSGDHPTTQSQAAKPPVPSSEKHISVWISECSEGLKQPLQVGQAYTLNFKVGQPVLSSLVSGPATEVPSTDIPETGLTTEWAIISQSVELAPLSSDTSVTSAILGDSKTWTARFSLHIPREGDSPISQLIITPQTVPDAHLDVVVYARREVYRQFRIRLAVDETTKAQAAGEAISIQDELLHAPAAHMNLRTSHEWTTPPGELSIAVIGLLASVRGDAGAAYIDQITQWSGVQAVVAGPIKNVRSAAERFRARQEDYLNDVKPDDLAKRLQQWRPAYDWAQLESFVDAPHDQRWENAVRVSSELRDLAFYGHQLYEAFFPTGSDLRRWLEALAPGHRLDISWLPGLEWIPHVPWGLMYLPDVPAPGEPIDPLGFLALRFRLGYTAHAVQAGSKALGGLEETHRAHFLYWGDNPQDITGREAQWQQQQWAAWKNQVFIPAAQCLDRKVELLQLLNEPKPAPMAVLYLFCQCNTGDGNDPVLRFGSSLADVVRQTELGTKLLTDRPFVFANACTTAATDPYIANELEKSFFARGCRAYLGTETKVPIQFASRFASVFFHFFYRLVDPTPMAAGEALAQTRLFLWTRYRNIGGLFYTYINQYELFMAQDAEVRALRG